MFEWLIESNAWKRLEAILKSDLTFTDKQVEAFTPLAMASESDPHILTRADDKAEILIDGILTEKFDFKVYLSGGSNTTYQDIRASLALADQDEDIKEMVLLIGSPGGQFVGLFETIEAINKFSKPIKTVVKGQASSAAYALAAATDSIEASNKADLVGSVGTVAVLEVNENEVTVANSKSPKKAPDVTTEAGKKVIREQLDDMYDLFVEAIADGRGTTVKDVNDNFGKGAVFLANKALKNGMIDKIQSKAVSSKNKSIKAVSSQIKPRVDSGKREVKVMDLTQLMAEHPGVYAQAIAKGVEDGIKKERDRASAHLTYGASSGAMDIAVKAVKEGTEMTQTLQAEYMTATKNKADVGLVLTDEQKIAAAANNVDNSTDADKEKLAGDNILAQAAANCNVKIDAPKVVA